MLSLSPGRLLNAPHDEVDSPTAYPLHYTTFKTERPVSFSSTCSDSPPKRYLVLLLARPTHKSSCSPATALARSCRRY